MIDRDTAFDDRDGEFVIFKTETGCIGIRRSFVEYFEGHDNRTTIYFNTPAYGGQEVVTLHSAQVVESLLRYSSLDAGFQDMYEEVDDE